MKKVKKVLSDSFGMLVTSEIMIAILAILTIALATLTDHPIVRICLAIASVVIVAWGIFVYLLKKAVFQFFDRFIRAIFSGRWSGF